MGFPDSAYRTGYVTSSTSNRWLAVHHRVTLSKEVVEGIRVLEWHIITGEFPPKPGGVSDYTYRLAEALCATSRAVHIWAPEFGTAATPLDRVEVHPLPRGFGFRWLRALDRGLKKHSARAVIVQYVPHSYGWKAMNLAFCFWLARQRHRNVWVMFHEVAFPFKSRQPIKHHFLAAMHRLMAWIVLRNAKQSFTSIEAYQELLTRLSPDANVGLLRIFSNVPFDVSQELAHEASAKALRDHRVLGVFSSYGVEICELMEGVLPTVMENSSVQVKLVGPGSAFLERFCARFPHLKDRLSTTGRVSALDAGPHLQACDLLLQLYPDGAAGARGTFVAALASGVPVITTAGPFTEPLLKSSRAVAFSDPEPQAIRRVIDDMLADQNLIQELGAAGRRLYLDHFAVAVTVGKLQEAAQAGALLTSKQAAQLRSQAAR